MYKKMLFLTSLTLLLMMASQAGAADPNLVGWYTLDESSGSTANDSSNYNIDGTVYSTVWAPTGGMFNGAVTMGTDHNDYISVPGTYLKANKGTAMGWLRVEGTQSGTRYAFGHMAGGWANRIQIYCDGGDNQLDFGLGGTHLIAANVVTLTADTWYHAALTWNNGTYYIYINGTQAATGSYTSLTTINTVYHLGNNSKDPFNEGWQGKLDDWQVWDVALTESEVRDQARPDQATSPSPANSATGVSTTADLSWTAGAGATSHDVYFGTSSPGTFRGNQTATTYDCGTMPNNTVHYWRIDEVNPAGTTTGTVWSFTTIAAPPGQASNPSPANSATGVSVTADLSWTAGSGATSHAVYFGTSSPGTYRTTTTSTTYDCGTMPNGTVHYWRIDEINAGGTTTGTVWSFTTLASGTPPTFVSAGTVASGTGTITPALPGSLQTNDILLLAVESANQAASITNQNGGTWAEVTNSPQGTGTAGSTGATRLTVFWSRYNGTQGAPTVSDSGNHTLGRIIAIRGAITTGNPWDVTAGGVEATSDTSGSIPGATTTVANTLVVAIIATDLPDASGTANFSAWTNANLASLTERTDNTVTAGNGGGLAMATGVKDTTGAYGNTAVTLASSAVKGMMSIAIKAGPPGQASNPSPANSATNVSITADLSWTAGSSATSHAVYFGTSSPGTFRGTQGATTYDCGTMPNNTVHYWRIDEINANGTTTGTVWSFTTIVAAPGQASSPSPSNGATGVSTTADLSWTAGSGATSHNVNFGTSSPGTFRGNQTATTYDCGTMTNSTVYYWRIDEVNAGGTTNGNVWSFTTTGGSAPGKATNPSPANSATGVSTTADLSWSAGANATSHNVYFGTTSPGTFQGNRTSTTYDCGTMTAQTVYYWRIDEVNASGTTTGDVWAFRVGPLAAFPGAEGYGAVATGGRGGSVIKVTNLNTSGAGSMAAACSTSGTRTVVFDVSGVIPGQVLITQSNVTIAGQTAPGAGITIQGMLKSYGYAIDNAIVRFLRIRPNQPAPGGQTDAIQMGGDGTSTMIFDHISVAWGNDEVFDIYNANTVTLQWSTIEESDPCNHPEGKHNFGMISAATGSGWISIHHNLFTHHYRRVPCLAPYKGNGEYVSNVAYNCFAGYSHDGHGVNITGDLNLYNNYYARGPNCLTKIYPYACEPTVDYYIEDVYFENWGYQDHPCEWIPYWLPGGGPTWIQYNSAGKRIYSPAACSTNYPVTASTALQAYTNVIADAGCFPRDRITTQNAADVNAHTGAWRRTGPATPATSWLMYGLTPGSAPTDTDSDGMPDTWENNHGLNPNDASDRNNIVPNGASTGNRHMGYTYLEFYLNELAESLY